MDRNKFKKVGLRMLKCCLCDSELKNGKRLYEINKNTQIRQCPHCSMIFTFPPPYYDTKDCLIYKDPFALHQCKNAHAIYYDYARFLLRLIPKEKRLNKTVLDFGCGNGEALFLLKENGMKTYGVEINKYQRDFLLKKGLDVRTSIKDFKNITYDYIICSHIIEHLPNPKKILKKLKQLMYDDSSMLIILPNYNSFLRKILGPYWCGFLIEQHLWHFHSQSLINLITSVGFKVESMELYCLGSGLNLKGKRTYENAGFLIETKKKFLLRAMNKILYVLDLKLLNNNLGKLIRSLSEIQPDQIFLVIKKQSNQILKKKKIPGS